MAHIRIVFSLPKQLTQRNRLRRRVHLPPKSTAITSDVAWRKLAALVEGANRATFRYVNAHAPAESPELFAPTPFRVFLVDGGANVGVAAMPLLEAALRERCERGTNTGTTVVAAPARPAARSSARCGG